MILRYILLKSSNRRYSLSFLLLLFCLAPISLLAQTQSIQGTVKDSKTQDALISANIVLLDTEPSIGTATDLEGKFILTNVPVGRYYTLQVSYLGYETLIVPEVLVESGKAVTLDLVLNGNSMDMRAIILRAERRPNRLTNPVSQKVLTVEETRRFPATFNDAARLATTFAGVINDNDQANGMAIRGNSPNAMSWKLQGVDIVNPNHLSNAGTFGDRATQNGGGVNILSAQLLDKSNFYTGAFSAQHGNALSGIMDMHLRKGSTSGQEYTAQAGLLGLEFAAEGPISPALSSYAVNYRYSTLGLLTALGVEVSDEEIDFQDLAFNTVISTENAGRFSVFGMGGLSNNVFVAERDTAVWEFQKDRFDISFKSKMGVLGLSHLIQKGKTTIESTVAYSARQNERESDRLDDEFVSSDFADDSFIERKISLASRFTHNYGTFQLFTGFEVNQLDYDLFSTLGNTPTLQGDGNGILLRPYANIQYGGKQQRLLLNLGLHYQYFSFNQTQALEPRVSARLALANAQSISFAYGLHSQLQLPQLYFAQIEGGNPNESLGFTRAHHLVLNYEKFFGKKIKFTSELYYQHLFDVPIIDDPNSSFSALNLIENFVLDTLSNAGTGTNYGVEFSLQRFFNQNYFYLFNASLYESTYQGGDLIQRDTRYNGNYTLNLTGGKEWGWNKKGKRKVFGLNARLAYFGGLRDTPIDMAASQATGTTIYVEKEAFSIKQSDYFKLDLRLYLKNNSSRKFTSTLSLDIQNATNQENTAYSYFDPEQGEIIVKNQLGLIPILSYRAEF